MNFHLSGSAGHQNFYLLSLNFYLNKKALRPISWDERQSFRGTTQIRTFAKRTLEAPVTVGIRPCLRGGSRANQTKRRGLAFSRWPVLSWRRELVIFPFIADINYHL